MHDGERMERRKWESDREALEQIKVKLSAFTYLDERFQSACLIISSPFFICTLFDPKAAGREESLALSLSLSHSLHHYFYQTHSQPSLTLPLTLHPLRPPFVIRVINIRFLSIRTCSSYLPHAPCSHCLSPCFMHTRILPHMCPKVCVCAQRFTANAPSTTMFYASRCAPTQY